MATLRPSEGPRLQPRQPRPSPHPAHTVDVFVRGLRGLTAMVGDNASALAISRIGNF